MPELPEVETVRRGLQSSLPGAEVEQVSVRPCRVFRSQPGEFNAIEGQAFGSLRRRGKYLVLELQRHFLIVHLGMTGQLTVRDPSQDDSPSFLRSESTGLQRIRQHAPDRHTHLEVLLRDGRQLLYRDPRMFGRIELLDRDEAGLASYLSHLGLEPLTPEYSIDSFSKRLRNRRIKVKSLLLDQAFVAGVGNIYADEALFEAGIHPLRLTTSLRKFEKELLFHAIPLVLEKGILFGGTTLRDYVNSDGQEGGYQEELAVYGREGQPCRNCETPILKIVVSQRGTHFCPSCQPRRSRPVSRLKPTT